MDENGTQTWTLYDRGNPIMDFSSSGSLTMRYLWGPTGIVARQTSGGTVSWYLADHLGTVRDIINNSGAIIDHVDFSAFGTVLGETSPTSGDRMMGFAGLERDTVTGLNLAVFREENPGTGRWDSQDPLGFAAGDTNLYRYAGNNPTNATDPIGLIWIESGITLGTGYQKGNWLFGWFPIHSFLVIDGRGYGFFEVRTNPVGNGQWRDDDLIIYPNKKPKNGSFYSVQRPFLIDSSRYDLAWFRRRVRERLKEAAADPGFYATGVRDCNTERYQIILGALEDSRLDKRYPVLDADVNGTPAPGLSPP